MNTCDTQWTHIPTLVLGQIYECLEPADRYNASETCSHWRGVLFQKRFFRTLKFKLDVENNRQITFFRNVMCNLTNELVLIFDFMNVFHIEKIRRIINQIAYCDNIQGIRFQTNNVGLIPPGDVHEDNLVQIEQSFVKPLKVFLGRKKIACKILDLGTIEALTYYGLDLLKSLSKPEKLEQLTLASIKYDPSHYPIFGIENMLLQQCKSLQVLSLDYDTLNDEVIQTIQLLPLKKFLICIHGLDREHPGISETTWASFSTTFPNIELFVSLVYAYEAVEVLQVRILRRNMPITHLRVLFCDFINVDALEWMSIKNSTTLRSIQWIDSAYKHSDKSVMDLFLRSGQDPFVMLSWRCKNLEEIVIHGYVLDPHNIVGISRLRGRTLKRLEVSMVDNTPTESTMDSFIEEINMLIGQKWRPLNTSDLHPALGYMPVPEEVRDDYVFDLMRALASVPAPVPVPASVPVPATSTSHQTTNTHTHIHTHRKTPNNESMLKGNRKQLAAALHWQQSASVSSSVRQFISSSVRQFVSSSVWRSSRVAWERATTEQHLQAVGGRRQAVIHRM